MRVEARSAGGETVGDGPGVAGHPWRGGVEFLDQAGQRPAGAGAGGRVEGDGDRVGVVGDVAGLVEQVAGDGPVVVQVAQLGLRLSSPAYLAPQ